jgi:hypothetical protein
MTGHRWQRTWSRGIVNTEVITAVVVVILAVIPGLRRIIPALGLPTQESSTFIGHIVVFSKEGRVPRGELRKWRDESGAEKEPNDRTLRVQQLREVDGDTMS